MKKNDFINLEIPKLPNLPEEIQKNTKAGYTLSTVTVYPDESIDPGDGINHGDSTAYEGPIDQGGGETDPGDGNDNNNDNGGNNGNDPDTNEPQEESFAEVLMVDAADGQMNQKALDKLSTAATAAGMGLESHNITYGILESFSDILKLSDGGQLVTKVLKGVGYIGVVTDVVSLAITVKRDGITTDDWDEAASVLLGLGGIAAVTLGAPITALVIGALSIGVAVVSMTGSWGSEADAAIDSLANKVSI